ncbi:MAG TPA: methyltransferase domain-containing protein [bacterium]|nr:methyltransferase domain-containing protein [bacterium]
MEAVKNKSLLNVESLINKVVSTNNDRIADLGCGSFGYFVFPLAKRIGKHGRVYAIDIIKSNLESIKKIAKVENLTQVETIWSDLEILGGTKIEDNSLDSILLVSTLHQSDNYNNIILEGCRMLRLGGKALIVEWNNEDGPFNTNGSRRIRRTDLKKALDATPLEVIEEFEAGDHHYGMLLVKK